MKNKILIPLLVVGALAAFFSFKYSGGDQSSEEKKALVQSTVMKAIKDGHYSPRDLNDSFSYSVYNKVLEELDGEKKFFTQEDINKLEKYKYQIDDEIKAGSIEFYKEMSSIFAKRLDEADSFAEQLLRVPFTFTSDDSIQLNGEKINWASNDDALKARWHEYLKYRVLAKYVDLKKDQEKKKEDKKNKDKTKSDAELEAEARKGILKNEQYVFKRWHKLQDNDMYTLYVNAIAHTEDPHTDYFPPKDKERFDEAMSGAFYGIGAQLKPDGDKIKVQAIITGSPCWKQGELKAGDEITKVAQGDKEPVDVQGYDLEDVVQLIRGPKGSEVRLTVKRVNGSVGVVPIIRGEVMLEDVFAKSAIIKSKDGPIGYIYLPEFYADFNHVNSRRCSEDVAIEVKKLKTAGVKGIILDLRNNGGGSLSDVVDMAGIFVGGGPVVQVRSSDAAPMTLPAPNRAPIYDGPMAVMVNQNSASASEIMAAALQDYKRAVIVGSPTYGKGTVQRVEDLDAFIDPVTRMRMASDSKSGGSIGSLKITMQKFYRVNGGSTQLRGVTPDIILPDPYALIDLGERHDKSALKWDEIPPANYTPTNSVGNVANLEALSRTRTNSNQTFNVIQETAERLKKQEEDNTVSLNEQKFRKEQDDINATSKKLEDLQKKTTAFEFSNPKDDLTRVNADSASIAKNKEWLKALGKDIYISETVNIVDDMMKSEMKVNMATGMK
jgi:carboxyl-terminal processing protease